MPFLARGDPSCQSFSALLTDPGPLDDQYPAIATLVPVDEEVNVAETTSQRIRTTAPPELVYEIAADVPGYPDWASGMRESEVLEWDGDGMAVRASFVVDAMIRRISYVLRYSYDAGEISWVAEPGPDIRDMEGKYEFYETDDGGTEIVYTLSVTPAFSLPGLLRRQAEKQIISSALKGLKAEAERRLGT